MSLTKTPRNHNLNRTSLNKAFHALVNKFRLDSDEKRLIVRQVSYNTCESVKDLTDIQLKEAVNLLSEKQSDSIKRMRAKAINIARDLNLVTGEGKEINWTGLNNFSDKNFKSKFYELSSHQLRDCITALEKWKDYKLSKQINEL